MNLVRVYLAVTYGGFMLLAYGMTHWILTVRRATGQRILTRPQNPIRRSIVIGKPQPEETCKQID